MTVRISLLWMVAIATIGFVLRSPSTAQHIGDRVGDVCRTIAISHETDLALLARPIATDVQGVQDVQAQTQSDTAAAELDENYITLLFDREQVALLNANQRGVDGDTNLWHEIEDSIGNRGYMRAIDPATNQSTLIDCL